MYHVLIVDDEPRVCKAISNYLQKIDLDISFVQMAYNGFEALDYLRVERFDLVLTDIQMGGMNGIELMEAIFAEKPEMPVVVISAHEQFQYAQRAMRLGAKDYLVKPVELSHLKTVVNAVLQDGTIRNRELMEQSAKQRYSAAEMLSLRTFLLHELLTEKDVEMSDLEEMYAYLGFRLDGPMYSVMLASLDLNRGGFQNNGPLPLRDRKLLQYGALNVLEECVSQWNGIAFCGMGNAVVAIIQWPEEDRDNSASKLLLLARTIHSNIKKYLNIDNTIGLSRIVPGVGQLPYLYREAMQATEWQKAHPGHDVFYIEDMSRIPQLHNRSWESMLDGFVSQLKQVRDGEEARLHVADFNSELERLFPTDESFAPFFPLFAYRMYSFAAEYSEELREQYVAFEPNVYFAEGLAGRRAAASRYVSELAEAVFRSMVQRDQSVVHRTIEYLHSAYGNKGLKLQDIASHVHLSANYLSYLFKSMTGNNLWDYLTEIRMEKAKKLLLHTDKKRYEIADEIGYESPEHFGRLFKKLYGVSPVEFKGQGGTP